VAILILFVKDLVCETVFFVCYDIFGANLWHCLVERFLMCKEVEIRICSNAPFYRDERMCNNNTRKPKMATSCSNFEEDIFLIAGFLWFLFYRKMSGSGQ
jgi:hypothetical protein